MISLVGIGEAFCLNSASLLSQNLSDDSGWNNDPQSKIESLGACHEPLSIQPELMQYAHVENATVVFIADAGNFNATGVTDKSGKFSMKAFEEKKGAVPGSYKVEITKTVVEGKGDKGGEAVVNLTYGLPKKYASFTTSGLKYTIPEKNVTDMKLKLVSK